MKRARCIALVLVLTLGLAGCGAKLTEQEKVKAQEIAVEVVAATQDVADAVAKLNAVLDGVAGLVERNKDVLAKAEAVKKALEEKRIPFAEGAALLAKLVALKADIVKTKDQLEGDARGIKTELTSAKDRLGSAKGKEKALDAEIKDRLKAEGEKTSRFARFIGIVIAACGGGVVLTKAASAGINLYGELKKLRAGFKVVTTAIGTESGGKATADVCAKIEEGLAGSELSKGDLELLRVVARNGTT